MTRLARSGSRIPIRTVLLQAHAIVILHTALKIPMTAGGSLRYEITARRGVATQENSTIHDMNKIALGGPSHGEESVRATWNMTKNSSSLGTGVALNVPAPLAMTAAIRWIRVDQSGTMSTLCQSRWGLDFWDTCTCNNILRSHDVLSQKRLVALVFSSHVHDITRHLTPHVVHCADVPAYYHRLLERCRRSAGHGISKIMTGVKIDVASQPDRVVFAVFPDTPTKYISLLGCGRRRSRHIRFGRGQDKACPTGGSRDAATSVGRRLSSCGVTSFATSFGKYQERVWVLSRSLPLLKQTSTCMQEVETVAISCGGLVPPTRSVGSSSCSNTGMFRLQHGPAAVPDVELEHLDSCTTVTGLLLLLPGSLP
nr:hypothetical protein CFP56_13397 [Quercus suber]